MQHRRYGNFNFQLNSTYVHKYEYQNSEGGEWHPERRRLLGHRSGIPLAEQPALNWNQGEFGAGLAGHHKTGYIDQDPDFSVASYTTFDGYLSWTMKKGFGLTAGVRNMFDRNPPLSYQTQTFQAGYDPRYTDPTGRTLYVARHLHF